MKQSGRALLCTYLCVFFAFPPQVWAEEAPEPRPTWNEERLALYDAFLLAAWRLAHFLKAPGPSQAAALALREEHIRIFLEPFFNCPDPGPVDEHSLQPLQKRFSEFLENHILELGQVEAEDATPESLGVPSVRSPKNGAVCIPQPQSPSTKAASIESLILSTESELAQIQRPMHLQLLSKVKHGGVATNLEVRRWVAWLVGLRDYWRLTERLGGTGTPIPAATFSEGVGEKLQLNYSSAKDSAGTLGAAFNDLPSFPVCSGDEKQRCLKDPPISQVDRVREEIVRGLRIGNYDHGRGLEALRKYSLLLKGLPERAIIQLALGNDGTTLDIPACSTSATHELTEKYYGEFMRTAKEARVSGEYQSALDSLVRDYRTDKVAPPTVSSSFLLEEANIQALTLINTVLSKTPHGRGDLIREGIQQFSFAEYLSTRRYRELLPELIQGKLYLALAFLGPELSGLSENQRAQVLKRHIQEAYLFILNESLYSYASEIAANFELDSKNVNELWSKSLSTQWQSTLASPEARDELKRIAEEIFAQLEAHRPKRTPSMADWSRTNIAQYVDHTSIDAIRAAQADETLRFMESLSEWKNGAESIVPGPHTYYWNRAGLHFDPVPLRPENPLDYLHLKEALRVLAEQHRDKVTASLKQAGYTDEAVRAQYALPKTEHLSDLVLNHFSEYVEADPKKMSGPRTKHRAESLTALLNTLHNPTFRAEFEGLAGKLALVLRDERLMPFMNALPEENVSSDWEKQLQETLQSLSKERSLKSPPRITKLISLMRKAHNTPRAALTQITSAYSGHSAFDSWDNWKKFCEGSQNVCRDLIRTTRSLISQKDSLAGLYEWRALSHSLNYLVQFLNYYGAHGDLYVASPAPTANAEVVSSLKSRMSEAWFGFGGAADPKDLAAFDAFLVQLSQKAHAIAVPDTASEGFHRALLNDSQADLKALMSSSRSFERWYAHVKALEQTLEPLSQDPVSSLGPEQSGWPALKTLVTQELRFLTGLTLSYAVSPEESEWAKLLTLDFTEFRRLTTARVRTALAQGIDPFERHQDIQRSLQQLSFLKKPSEAATRRVVMLQSQLKEVEGDIRSYTELRTLIRNYLGDTPYGKEALRMDSVAGDDQEKWNAYRVDQLLDPEAKRTLSHLNAIALTVKPVSLPLSVKDAEGYRSEAVRYLSELKARPELNSLYYRRSIERAIASLPDFATSHAPLNIAGPTLFYSQLKKLYETKLAPFWRKAPAPSLNKNPSNGFEAFYQAFLKNPGPDTVTAVSSLLITPSDYLDHIHSEGQALEAFLKEKDFPSEAFRSFQVGVSRLANSGFTPFLVKEGTAVALPLPLQPVAIATRTDTGILLNLEKALGLLSPPHRNSLIELGKASEFHDSSIMDYLNRISSSERIAINKALLAFLDNGLSTSQMSVIAKALFRDGAPTAVDRKDWERHLERLMFYAEKNLEKLRNGAHRPLTALISGALAEQLAPLGYKPKLDSFGHQVSFIRDSIVLFRKEKAATQPFSKADNISDWGKVSSASATVRFYLSLLRTDDVLLNHLVSNINIDPALTRMPAFSVSWAPGTQPHLVRDFGIWLHRLLTTPNIERLWGEYRAKNPKWDLPPTPALFVESPSHKQLLRLLANLDANTAMKEGRGTFPMLLVLLNWAINHTEAPPPVIAPRARPLPPSPGELDALLSHVVTVMGIDLTRFDSWKSLLDVNQGAPPEAWALVARSLRSGLAEIQGGFLGVTIDAPQVQNPNTLFSNHTYIAYPIVDASERDLYCTDDNFATWSQKANDKLNPNYTPWLRTERELSVSQSSRLDNDVRGAKTYQHFHERNLLHTNDLVGEGDLESPFTHDHFKTRWNNWGSHPFGKTISQDQRRALGAAFTASGVRISDDELEKIQRLRDALVDFRRTMNEINVEEGLNFWNESKGLFTGSLETQVNLALKQFWAQVSPDSRASIVVTPRAGTFVERRRALVAQAIYLASHLVHDTLYKGRNPKEISRTRLVVHTLDTLYTKAVEAKSVQRTLEQVSENLDHRLSLLCQSNFSDIKTEANFTSHKSEILESGLPFFNAHQKELFGELNWAPKAATATWGLLQDLSQQITARAAFMKTVEYGFNTAMILSVVALVSGKNSPSLSRWLVATSGRRTAATVSASIITALWLGIEANGLADDFMFVPQELKNKLSIRDSQFAGDAPFMSPETAAAIFDATRSNQSNQVSTFRWTFRVLATIAGLQMVLPWLRSALGGAPYLYRLVRRDFRGIANARLANVSQGLRLPGVNAIAALDGVSAGEAKEKFFDALIARLKGKRVGQGLYNVDAAEANRLARDADRQADLLARELGLDPNDLGPLKDESLAWIRGKALADHRAKLIPRIKELRAWANRFRGQTIFYDHEILDGVMSVVGTESDIASRYVPIWLRFFGVSYPTPSSLSLSRLQKLNRARADILAYYHPNVRYSLAQLSEVEGRIIQPWEIFAPRSSKTWAKTPRDVQGLLKELRYEAETISKNFMTGGPDTALNPYTDLSAEAKTTASQQLQREMFDEILLGRGETSLSQGISPQFAERADVLRERYGASRFNTFVEDYLVSQGMALPEAERQQLEALNRLAAWDARHYDLVVSHVRDGRPLRRSTIESDIQDTLVAMIDPTHKRHSEFIQTKDSPLEFDSEANPVATDGLDKAPSISDAAEELRQILGQVTPSYDLLNAISERDYARMASALMAKPVNRYPNLLIVNADTAEPEAELEPAAITPRKPRPEYEGPVIPTKTVTELKAERLRALQIGEVPNDLREAHRLISGREAFTLVPAQTVMDAVPPASRDLVARLLSQGMTHQGIDAALSELIKTGSVTSEMIAGYRIARENQLTLDLIIRAEKAGTISGRAQAEPLYQWCNDRYLRKRAASIARTPRKHISSLMEATDAAGFPPEYLESQELVAGYFKKHVVIHGQAEDLIRKLYHSPVRESIIDAQVTLGLLPEATEAQITARAEALRKDLRSLANTAESPLVHEEAIRRVDLAEKILKAPREYPARYIAPKVFAEVPKIQPIEEDLPEIEALFNDRLAKLKEGIPEAQRGDLAKTLDRVARGGFFKERDAFAADLGAGRLEAGSLEHDYRQKVLDLMQCEGITAQARITGVATTDEEAVKIFDDLFAAFQNPDIRFRDTLFEAETAAAAATGMSTSQLQFAQKVERLERYLEALKAEGVLVADGKGSVSPQLLARLFRGAEVIKASLYPKMRVGPYGYFGLEATLLRSHLKVPFEVVIDPSILSNRRLVYLLLDGKGTDAKMVGDLLIDALSEEGGQLIGRLGEGEVKEQLFYELARRWQWNRDILNIATPEAVGIPTRTDAQLMRGLQRLNPELKASETPQIVTPEMDRPGQIILPSSAQAPESQRLILPPDFKR
ncbi:MAG: hypothetical protein HYR96_03175 [Deltaproteobacteria bacterium]|nr:hypothetical protein [Deltaproteobacteria bacterium]MBI3294315.1 hypothetical protein [Deltaproteobacteria bacterium]